MNTYYARTPKRARQLAPMLAAQYFTNDAPSVASRALKEATDGDIDWQRIIRKAERAAAQAALGGS